MKTIILIILLLTPIGTVRTAAKVDSTPVAIREPADSIVYSIGERQRGVKHQGIKNGAKHQKHKGARRRHKVDKLNRFDFMKLTHGENV